jgi:hypothetical protein
VTKRTILRALAAGATVAAAAAALLADGRAGEPPQARKLEPPRTERGCKARGGQWLYNDFGLFHFCALKTGDAGKACSDDAQCEGDCVPAERNAALPGVCAPTLPMPGGCPRHLVRGKLVEEPCI